jgi:nicotinate-nucleotide adenylyltransferase
VDTLRYFRSEHPDARIFFILGADQLAEFHEWKEPQEILELATLVAVARAGAEPKGVVAPKLPSGQAVEFRTLEVPRVDISASSIRERVASGRTIRYMVPEAVNDIIERYRLYRGT